MKKTQETLAIYGGKKIIPDGTFKPWPPLNAIDKKYVLASLNGHSHAFGPNAQAFEGEFAEWNGNKFAINTNSGTAALHMCVAACGLGAGDHVIVPAYSWSSSATCVLHHNCIPVFVDIDFATMNIDTKKIEAAITKKTKAIIVVHLHGLAVNMNEIMAIAKKHNLYVIEDACQSHGAMFKGKKVGLFGHCAAFSFNQNKCLCSGEGGMFVSDDEELYKNARALWSFGETRTPAETRDYHAYALGWMYRSNDLTSAFGRAQLTKLDDYIKTQHENASLLLDLLKGTPNLILPVEPAGHFHTYYNFTCRIDMQNINYHDYPKFRNAVAKAICKEGVKVGAWQQFILPAMTVFQAKNAYGKGCPWTCQHTEPVKYDASEYKVAQLHTDTNFGLSNPIRKPHGKSVVKLIARAFQKVFTQLDKIEPEKILKIK
jgi:dTDP-4-amino-4,6-dideoxygalactose transaminase